MSLRELVVILRRELVQIFVFSENNVIIVGVFLMVVNPVLLYLVPHLGFEVVLSFDLDIRRDFHQELFVRFQGDQDVLVFVDFALQALNFLVDALNLDFLVLPLLRDFFRLLFLHGRRRVVLVNELHELDVVVFELCIRVLQSDGPSFAFTI